VRTCQLVQALNSQQSFDSLIGNLSLMGDHRVANDFIFEIQLQAAILDHIEQELDHIVAEHLTGVTGNVGGDVGWPQDSDPMLDDTLVSLAEFTVATTFSGQIDSISSRCAWMPAISENRMRSLMLAFRFRSVWVVA